MQQATAFQLELGQQIHEANQRFVQAMNAGDYAGAARGLYTRAARLLPPGAPMVEGREAIAAFWQATAAQLGVRRVELHTEDLQGTDEQLVEIGRAVVELPAVAAEFKYVVIWKQEEGRWCADLDMWNANA